MEMHGDALNGCEDGKRKKTSQNTLFLFISVTIDAFHIILLTIVVLKIADA